MRLRQSFIRQFASCPLKAKFDAIDLKPGLVSAKMSFGTCIHYALEVYNTTNGDLAQAINVWKDVWFNPDKLGCKPDYYHPRSLSHEGYMKRGIKILKEYHERQAWDSREVIGVEHQFLVPFGEHELTGTVDLLELKRGRKDNVLRITDYKSTSKQPTVVELRQDIQYTCLDPTTPILMADLTWKPIDSLVVGEEVYGVDEEPSLAPPGKGSLGRDAIERPLRRWHKTKVTAKWHVEEDAFELRLSDGTKLTASANHRFLAKRSGRWTWRTVAEMAEVLSSPRRKTPGIEIASTIRRRGVEWESPEYEAGYLAGATLGDGCISSIARDEAGFQPYWRIGVGEGDEALLRRIRLYALAFGLELTSWRREADGKGWQRRPMVGLQTSKRADVEALRAMGQPSSSLAWKAGWLAGLYDTDGSLTTASQAVFHQRSLVVLETVCRYAGELGFRAKVAGKQTLYVQIPGSLNDQTEFFALIRPALSRKIGSLDWRLAACREDVRLLDVIPIGRKRLVDISTGTQTFVADGIVSHNCYWYASLQPEFWLGNGSDFPPMEDGEKLWERLRGAPRRAIMYGLWFNKEFDAGERNDRDFLRLHRVADMMQRAIDHDVFVPNISGESCTDCPYQDPCGLPFPEDLEALADAA